LPQDGALHRKNRFLARDQVSFSHRDLQSSLLKLGRALRAGDFLLVERGFAPLERLQPMSKHAAISRGAPTLPTQYLFAKIVACAAPRAQGQCVGRIAQPSRLRLQFPLAGDQFGQPPIETFLQRLQLVMSIAQITRLLLKFFAPPRQDGTVVNQFSRLGAQLEFARVEFDRTGAGLGPTRVQFARCPPDRLYDCIGGGRAGVGVIRLSIVYGLRVSRRGDVRQSRRTPQTLTRLGPGGGPGAELLGRRGPRIAFAIMPDLHHCHRMDLVLSGRVGRATTRTVGSLLSISSLRGRILYAQW
jgi:hypothetical protein